MYYKINDDDDDDVDDDNKLMTMILAEMILAVLRSPCSVCLIS